MHLTIFTNEMWWGSKTIEMTLCSPSGTTVHELKGQVAEATHVVVEDQKWIFAGSELHDQEVMCLDQHGPMRPWFISNSKGKMVTMQLPRLWDHKLVLAMGTHSRSMSLIKKLPGDVLKKICVFLKSLLQPPVLQEGSGVEQDEETTQRRVGNVPYHSSCHLNDSFSKYSNPAMPPPLLPTLGLIASLPFCD